MKKTLLLLTFLTVIPLSYSQDSTYIKLPGKKALQFCLNDAFYKNFNITYTGFYRKNRAYEVMAGYRIQLLANIWSIFSDPGWYYNQYTVRAGLRFYNFEGLYFSPMISTYYGYYKNVVFEEYEGRKNYYPIISRDRTGFGGIAKFGFTSIKKRFVMDIYLGLGYRLYHINEKIVDPRYQSISKSTFWKREPTVQVGIQVGVLFNRTLKGTL